MPENVSSVVPRPLPDGWQIFGSPDWYTGSVKHDEHGEIFLEYNDDFGYLLTHDNEEAIKSATDGTDREVDEDGMFSTFSEELFGEFVQRLTCELSDVDPELLRLKNDLPSTGDVWKCTLTTTSQYGRTANTYPENWKGNSKAYIIVTEDATVDDVDVQATVIALGDTASPQPDMVGEVVTIDGKALVEETGWEKGERAVAEAIREIATLQGLYKPEEQ